LNLWHKAVVSLCTGTAQMGIALMGCVTPIA
jgi:hypothetical protein